MQHTQTAVSPTISGRTAIQQTYRLDLMLGQIANFCPVISRNTIANNLTSLSGIWQTIRLHYGFQSTGAHFLDFADIHLQADERPEDMYQRLVAFVEDNMLQKGSVILHHGDVIDVDEEMSPSLQNMVVLTWLRLINPALTKLIKQRYGTELRSRTLASIKPEISQALESLLDEIASADTAQVMCTESRPNRRGQRPAFSRRKHSSQSTHQADGSSPLTIAGETTISLARKNNTFQFCGLVVQNLDVEMLAGTPFMEINDITIRPAK